MSELTPQTLTELTVTLLAAFTQNNTVRSEDLPDLILATNAALITTVGRTMFSIEEAAKYEPAVSIRKSLASRDFILSMIDGKPYKSLKRHLTAQGISPEQYRERYNLPSDYPMVAPEYSESRREFAINVGLGRPRHAADVGHKPAVASIERKVRAGKASESNVLAPKARARTTTA